VKSEMSKRCIFCGLSGKKTKEHIWSEWMHEYLPSSGGGAHSKGNFTFYDKTPLNSKTTERQGHVSTVKVRVVCKTCNSGWMSQLEENVKPILVKMFKKDRFVIANSEQTILSKWIAVKVIVGEFADSEIYVTPKADRLKLKESSVIPNYFAIYIGAHNSQSDSAWLRTSNTLAVSPKGPNPPMGDLNRNTQSVAFICGPLFIYVFASREEAIDSSNFFTFGKLVRLYPLQNNDLHWPPSNVLSESEIGKIAWALNQIGQYVKTTHIGDIPR
jgi:hypothetical protein